MTHVTNVPWSLHHFIQHTGLKGERGMVVLNNSPLGHDSKKSHFR